MTVLVLVGQILELRAREQTSGAIRALLDLAAEGRRPRCGEPADHLWWTSEDHDERARAARLCIGCPVLRLCAESAEDEGEIFVWAGVDHGTPTPAPTWHL